jgi:hypothetical protein
MWSYKKDKTEKKQTRRRQKHRKSPHHNHTRNNLIRQMPAKRIHQGNRTSSLVKHPGSSGGRVKRSYARRRLQEGSDDYAAIPHPPTEKQTKSSPSKPKRFGGRNNAPSRVSYERERNHCRH